MNPEPAPGFAWRDLSWGRALCCLPLEAVAPHVFTTRDVVLRGDGARGGWEALAGTLGVSPSQLVRLTQVHGVEAIVLRDGDRVVQAPSEDRLPRADAAMTDAAATAVAVQVADCVPLLVADPVTGGVAAVHAGWRGTAGGIARRVVRHMVRAFGSRPADLVAAVGPSIGPCCYQVGRDVVAAFRAAGWGDATWTSWLCPEAGCDRFRLDVAGANRTQLLDAGLVPARVHVCGLCTSCHPTLFHSYRRDGAGTGRLAGVIRPAGGRSRA